MRLRLGRFYEDQHSVRWVVIAYSGDNRNVYRIVRVEGVLESRWVDTDGQQDDQWGEAARHDTRLVRRVIPMDGAPEPDAIDDLAELV